jgi:hypothetical protein
MCSLQVHKVVALQQLVRKLGEADPAFALQPSPDLRITLLLSFHGQPSIPGAAKSHGVLREHGAHSRVLADVPQEGQEGHAPEPVQVVHYLQLLHAFAAPQQYAPDDVGDGCKAPRSAALARHCSAESRQGLLPTLHVPLELCFRQHRALAAAA